MAEPVRVRRLTDTVEPDPDTAPTVLRIFTLYVDGMSDEPVASATPDEIIALLEPTIQRYLIG